MKDKNFSVLDMAKSYSDEHNISPEDLFKKEEVKEEIIEVKNEELVVPPPPPKKKGWSPDASLLEGMDEMTAGPVTYKKDEIILDNPDKSLKDMAEKEVLESAAESMNEMDRKLYHINMIKKKFGIKHLQIPPGPIQTRIHIAASDTSTTKAMEGLTEIFQEIINLYPMMIMEWEDPSKNPNSIQNKQKAIQPEIKDIPEDIAPIEDHDAEEEIETETAPADTSAAPVQVVIDKSQLSEISWTKDEMEKIRNSRTFELNIIEDVSLPYSQIEDANDNLVDSVLAKYARKANDIVAVLPASKYRATFSGLSYTEIMDLSYAQEMNTLDDERKRWTIVYNHLHNPSIGDFIDFEDFLKKTSFIDLNYMLWNILCATAMEKEIIAIDCSGVLNGAPCGRSYEWIYSPKTLLDTTKINVAVLDDMKKTGEAASPEAINKIYKESMLNTNNTVELPSSKFRIVFGHISAYEYLTEIYPEIIALRESENPNELRAYIYAMLYVIKAFLFPKPDKSGYIRIKGKNNLIRTLDSLDEIDWQTVAELVKIMIEPYQFTFSLRDIVCPQCKTKSSITIDRIDRLLFIIARSLNSTNVRLKRN